MTSTKSDRTLEDWTEIFIRKLKQQAVAERADDVRTYNRLHKHVVATLKAIREAGPKGRDAFEGLLDHDMPQVRLWAAGEVLEWDTEMAIPVLGRLLIEELPDETTAMERVGIRMGASSHLEKHFGISSFDRNDLIEPLKAYGIDVPRRPERPWY